MSATSGTPAATPVLAAHYRGYFARLRQNLANYHQLYLMAVPAVAVVIIFRYIPMYGVQIAFKDFIPRFGITGSPWVGFTHFTRFFRSYQATKVIWNTIYLSLLTLIAGFPAPVILALLLNHLRSRRLKRTVQTVTYAPHFISTVVLVGMMYVLLSPSMGVYGHVSRLAGLTPKNLMGEPAWFRPLYVLSGIWQDTGWASIIYFAVLSSVDPQLYEAATIDGASRVQKMIYIDVPSLLPTMVILLILRVGQVLNVGFEKVFLMQNGLNLSVSEVITTYVYKVGLAGMQYSFSTAVNLFKTIINFILLILVNRAAKSVGQTSLW